MLNTPTFANNFDFILDIFIFSLSSCNKTLTVLGLLVVCINRMSLHTKFMQNVLNSLMKKISSVLLS